MTHYLKGGKKCVQPKETDDGDNIDEDDVPYDNTGGRSRLQCKDLSQTFKGESWGSRTGQRPSYTVFPAYSTNLRSWTYAYEIGSPYVCANDRICLEEVHNSMREDVYNFEKKPPYNRNPTKYVNQGVCQSYKHRNKFEGTTRRFSQPLASQYCTKLGMRLCDTNELLFADTRYTSNQYRMVWTKTPCKKITGSSNWDTNYFWLVHQYPLRYSESGYRICAHKDELNQYYMRTQDTTGLSQRFNGVSCCADTRHSPRFQLEYDDDNFGNNEATWPPENRQERPLQDGWTYQVDPNDITASGNTSPKAEGTMKLTYHSVHASPSLTTCKQVYDACMANDAYANRNYPYNMCSTENCKFIHGPVS